MSTVTCIQFNPIDENYFISGSIDGIVRIWGVYKKRVVDWVDAHDITSAICYQPDGKVRFCFLAFLPWTYPQLLIFILQVNLMLTYSIIPSKQGFVVGSLTGSCRFYEASGTYMVLLCWRVLVFSCESHYILFPRGVSKLDFVGIGNDLELAAEIHVQGRKKTAGNRITGIQVSTRSSYSLESWACRNFVHH